MQLPRPNAARAAARSVRADRHGHRGRPPRLCGAARRDGRRVRRLRRGWRVQCRADGHAAARARLHGVAPRAGPHDGGLRAERAGAAFAGVARREPDRLRGLRHRRGRSARLHRGRCRHCRPGSPQGRRSAAADHRHGQPEPAGLHVRPDIALRRRRCLSRRRCHRPHLAASGILRRPQGAGPDRPARSGGVGDSVRRDAADRCKPRTGLSGAEGDGAARTAWGGRVAGCGAGARPSLDRDMRLCAGAAHQCCRTNCRG
jgi:hypothetical protein